MTEKKTDLRDHLKGVHTAIAAHHVAMAKIYKARADEAKENDDDAQAKFCEKCQACHTDAAEAHVGFAKEAEKLEISEQGLEAAAGAGDLHKSDLVPTEVRGVIPDNIRLVTRDGSPDNSPIDGAGLTPEMKTALGI